MNNPLVPPLEIHRRQRPLRLEQPAPVLQIEYPDRIAQPEPILRIEYPIEREEPVVAEMNNNLGEVRVELREFARPIVGASGSCIRLAEAARNYELKGMYYNMLPSFYGLPNEDPLGFIREFYSVIQQMPLGVLNQDQLRMRCFPYTLKEKAKMWLLSLPDGSLTTWTDIYNKFMAKFYSPQKTSALRQKLATFNQQEGEPFHEAWERFKMLQVECPHHHYPA